MSRPELLDRPEWFTHLISGNAALYCEIATVGKDWADGPTLNKPDESV